MLFHAAHRVLPVAYALLPPEMGSRTASAMLLAIGLQESAFRHRRQISGPARGFWQFERGGVEGVLTHRASRDHATRVLEVLCYRGADVAAVHAALEHNDVLACVFARLLLWTLPGALPKDEHAEADGWKQYLSAWRPGKPHRETWAGNYGVAFDLVSR